MTAALRTALEARLRELEHVDVSPSAFDTDNAYWVNGKEILHFDADDVIDIRLTRREIRARRAELGADAHVELRRSSSADWLRFRFTEPADLDAVIELARVAAEAHRAADGDVPKPPPTGADLERRRRFH